MPQIKLTAFDRAIGWAFPGWGLSRVRNRVWLDLAKRSFSAGDIGRRTEGWNVKVGQGPNQMLSRSLPLIRERCRDLTRNNPWGASIIGEITSTMIQHGIIPAFANGDVPDLWLAWAETTQCDAVGTKDYYGIQRLVARTWADAGECFVRRVWRADRKPGEIPFALQVLEPEFIDTSRDGRDNTKLGIKFSDDGIPLGYWVYPKHPAEAMSGNTSLFVNAADMIHVYSEDRPGQIRGVPILAPVVMRLYDLDTFEQAELVKQQVASMFAGFLQTEMGFSGNSQDDPAKDNAIDHIEAGAIERLKEGQNIVFANPPQRTGYGEYIKQNLLAIAAGVGLTYEGVSGDYGRVTFLNGRMGQLRFYRRIDQWQWMMFIPKFCRRTMEWWREGAALSSGKDFSKLSVQWQPPVKHMVDPEKEIKATVEMVRAGTKTPFEAIREQGNDPIQFLDDYQAELAEIDERGLVFSTNVGKISGAGQIQPSGAEETESEEGEEDTQGEGSKERREEDAD